MKTFFVPESSPDSHRDELLSRFSQSGYKYDAIK